MTNQFELDVKKYETIKSLCAEGDRLADLRRYEEAVAEYNKAWTLVPSPQNDWEASTWILAAIADACFLGGYRTSAREALEYALTCPGGLGNPFLHMRYGQVLYDSGEHDGAAEELMCAYMGAGDEIFAGEEPKYLEFLKMRAHL
ncbi:hypothetical protein THUN1379_08510 [Paludibacterium sp. THUN1379]|uniref:tetratricopeptide repeat protein n=1 Tax=Paludibacterium sp. THUN1379 TaxID=3112107 RepID=UPI003085B709|nr:hypothetical protein THUN1379_08510 [Paludibacterium sp. THUN1379]